MKHPHRRRARIALLASAAPVLGALMAFNSFTASADTGDEDDTTSTAPSNGISISSAPVSGSSGKIITDDKPVGDLFTPGVDTSSDVVKTEPKIERLPGVPWDEQVSENGEWIPEIGRVYEYHRYAWADDKPHAPLRTQDAWNFNLLPLDEYGNIK